MLLRHVTFLKKSSVPVHSVMPPSKSNGSSNSHHQSHSGTHITSLPRHRIIPLGTAEVVPGNSSNLPTSHLLCVQSHSTLCVWPLAARLHAQTIGLSAC